MTLLVRGSRRIAVADPADGVPKEASGPFVAFFLDDEPSAEAILKNVAAGCAEFCFVGPRAEDVHDAVDSVLEVNGHVSIVTTYVVDETEACEYVVHAAMGGRLDVMAYVAGSGRLVSKLVAIVQGDSRATERR